MRGSKRAWVVAALLGGGVLGCGGSGGGGPIPLADFHEQATLAICHRNVLCGELPDQASCAAADQEQPHFFASLPQLVAEGRLRYDGAKARSCLDQLNGLPSCARHLLNAPGLADCAQVLVGQVPDGGDCFFSDECQSHGSCVSADSSCDSFTQCCAGTCATGFTSVPSGGDCSAASAVCVSGTACVPSTDGSSASCQPLNSTVGASCASVRCAQWLYCEPNTETCQAPVAEGAACNPDLNGLDCDDLRDRCDSSGHCSPRLAVGAACSTAQNACVGWATCDATTSTCVPLPRAGDSCVPPALGPACLGGVACDPTTSVCTLTPVDGSCL